MYTEQKRREWQSNHHHHYQQPERLGHGGLESRDAAASWEDMHLEQLPWSDSELDLLIQHVEKCLTRSSYGLRTVPCSILGLIVIGWTDSSTGQLSHQEFKFWWRLWCFPMIICRHPMNSADQVQNCLYVLGIGLAMHSNYCIVVFSCTSIKCNKLWSNLLLKMYSLILKMYWKFILCASAVYKCMGHILNLVCCHVLNFIHRRHKKVSNAGEHMYMGISIYGHRRQKKVRTPGIDIYWILRHERSTTLVSICSALKSGQDSVLLPFLEGPRTRPVPEGFRMQEPWTGTAKNRS